MGNSGRGKHTGFFQDQTKSVAKPGNESTAPESQTQCTIHEAHPYPVLDFTITTHDIHVPPPPQFNNCISLYLRNLIMIQLVQNNSLQSSLSHGATSTLPQCSMFCNGIPSQIHNFCPHLHNPPWDYPKYPKDCFILHNPGFQHQLHPTSPMEQLSSNIKVCHMRAVFLVTEDWTLELTAPDDY